MFPEHTYCGSGATATFPFRLSRTGTKSGKERARNRYAGYCNACGRYVPAQEGCISKTEGRWVVYC